MRAKKKPAPSMKKTTRQPRKRKTIPISPMHSSAEEYASDSDPVEEVQQVHSNETEPVAITAMVITDETTGPTSTATTTPTASISTATSVSASLPKKSRSSGFLSEEDEDKMIEWLQENRFIYDMKSKIYKDKSSKTTAWQTQADNLGFEVRCLLTWYDSVRTRYGKLAARPSGSGAELTDREKWILDNLKFLKPYIHRVKKKTPVSFKGKITDATVDDASSSIADEESTQDMQQRHDEDIADINMVLDGREEPVATHTTISLEQMPPSSTGGKKKTHAQKMKEQDAAFLSHMKERADATAKFRAEIMATAVTPIVSSPKKLDSSRSGFCNWFESVAESLHPSLWPSFKKKITPIIVSFDEQNDNRQISSTLSTPTIQPQTQSQTQAHTSGSVHRQHDTFPSVTSAHMTQQANFDSMMSYSGAGGCHSSFNPENRWQFRQQHSQEQRLRSLPPEIRMQSQQFVGYGAAYHGGYSESHAGSHTGSHTGTWATEDSRPPAHCVHHGSLSGQGRPKSVTTSTVVSGDQDESLLDITLTDTQNIPPTTSPSELVEIGAIVKPVSAD